MRFKCIDCKESFVIERPSPLGFKYCPRCDRTMWGTLYSDSREYLNHQHPIPDEELRRPSIPKESFRHFQAKYEGD